MEEAKEMKCFKRIIIKQFETIFSKSQVFVAQSF